VLVRRSGADVAALHLLGPYLADFKTSVAADDDFSHEVMRRHGIPEDMATVLGAVESRSGRFGSRGRVTRELREGDELTLRDRSFAVMHRPGHSPSDTIFWDADRGILIAGDHLLAHISSNPLIHRPLDPQAPGPGRRR